jgi:hypothetical protein
MRYEAEVVRLALVAGDDAVVEDTEFVDCDVRGPAVLVMQGDASRLEGNNIAGDVFALRWEIGPDRPRVIGAVLAKDCQFVGCKFTNVGFAGSADFLDRFLK